MLMLRAVIREDNHGSGYSDFAGFVDIASMSHLRFTLARQPPPREWKRMAGGLILYVCYDPAVLLICERLLMGEGYDVVTVLGTDGLMALSQVEHFDLA